jgi:DNA-binding GntR family transcriptional regulator
MLDRHWTLLAALWRNFGYGAQRFAGVANDHRHVIAAIEAHDQVAAASIMGAHAAKAKRELLARMPPPVQLMKGKRSA